MLRLLLLRRLLRQVPWRLRLLQAIHVHSPIGCRRNGRGTGQQGRAWAGHVRAAGHALPVHELARVGVRGQGGVGRALMTCSSNNN